MRIQVRHPDGAETGNIPLTKRIINVILQIEQKAMAKLVMAFCAIGMRQAWKVAAVLTRVQSLAGQHWFVRNG